MHAYEDWAGKAFYSLLPYCPLNCQNVAFLDIWKHAHYKVWKLTVTFLENQLNCSLIWYGWNAYRIDVYEHDNEFRKDIFYLEWRMSLMAWWVVDLFLTSYYVVSPFMLWNWCFPRVQASTLIFVGWWCGFDWPRSYLTLMLKE